VNTLIIPPHSPKRFFGIQLSEADDARLDELARKTGRTRSSVISLMIQAASAPGDKQEAR